jgi:hypothetical protein
MHLDLRSKIAYHYKICITFPINKDKCGSGVIKLNRNDDTGVIAVSVTHHLLGFV